MQYLKPNVCKQLEAMGLRSESGYSYMKPDKEHRKRYPDITSDFLVNDFGNGWLLCPTWKVGTANCDEYINAFTISDILLNADNARKLFEPKGHVFGYQGIAMFDEDGNELSAWYDIWQYTVHRLLDLHLLGTDIEPELQKAIESNL